ncbi:MAG: UDP-N-acetyl-D-glucosamine dehydrogenase [Solirubrobacterales bacterium]|jgi:hypothetical protein|nr:UDP-N-acetyl-D-glucosamine dehydrogenase [Solirubrobacterales bacterium]
MESLLREAIDAAQIPRGETLRRARRRAEARPPLIVEVDSGCELPSEEARLSEADAIVIRTGDSAGLRRACAAVCRRARRGQTIVLASAGYLGATRELLIGPLIEAGFEVGGDICVACSPPAAPGRRRVVGATGRVCAEKARVAVAAEASSAAVAVVSSPEAAELTVVLGEALSMVSPGEG